MMMMPSQTIRVMLVDDHTMVRKGLSLFLKAFDDLELGGKLKMVRTRSDSAEKFNRMSY